MSNLSVTATSVVTVPASRPGFGYGVAGAAITAGQWIYEDTSVTPRTLKVAAKGASTTATPAGVALNGAAIGQPVKYQKSGRLVMGATMVAGVTYVLSTAGGMSAVADLGAGDYTTYLGTAKTTTEFQVVINATGVVQPGS